jgi:hypothetical protein
VGKGAGAPWWALACKALGEGRASWVPVGKGAGAPWWALACKALGEGRASWVPCAQPPVGLLVGMQLLEPLKGGGEGGGEGGEGGRAVVSTCMQLLEPLSLRRPSESTERPISGQSAANRRPIRCTQRLLACSM